MIAQPWAKDLAGHPSIRTTMRYMHLSPAHQEKAIELLDRPKDAVDGLPTIEQAS